MSVPVSWIEVQLETDASSAGGEEPVVVTARVAARSQEEALVLANLARDADFATELATESAFARVSVTAITVSTLAPVDQTTSISISPVETTPTGPPMLMANPPECPIIGGVMVIINTGELVGTAPLVFFSTGSETLQTTIISANSVAFMCPPSSETSELQGQLVGNSGEILALFDFEYVTPPPSISPSRVVLPGGLVTIQILGLPAPSVSETCEVLVRGVAADFISSESSGATTTVRIRVPRLDAPGIANVRLTCLPDVELALQYDPVPSVASLITPTPEGCRAWQQCDVVVSVNDPPPSVTSASDLQLTCAGSEVVFGPLPGSEDTEPRLSVEFFKLLSSVFTLHILFPPPLTAGTIECVLSPLIAPAGLLPTDLSATIAVESFLPDPGILSIDPVSVISGTQALIRVDTTGFGPIPSASALDVTVGGTKLPVTLLFADTAGGAFTMNVPSSLPVGEAVLLVELEGRVATAKFAVKPASGVEGTCLDG
eukprot:401854-Rhodomonas_salina.2